MMEHSSPLLLLIGETPEAQQRAQRILSSSIKPPAFIRQELWKQLANIGLTQILDTHEVRTPEQLAAQAKALRIRMEDDVPVVLNLNDLSNIYQTQLLSLLPDALVIGPDQEIYGQHMVVRTPQELQAVLGTPSSIHREQQEIPTIHLSQLLPTATGKRPHWDLKQTQKLLQTYTLPTTGALRLDDIAPAFVYSAFAAQLSPDVSLYIHLPSNTEQPWPACQIKPIVQEGIAPYTTTIHSIPEQHTTRLELTLAQGFDINKFLNTPHLVLPEISEGHGVILSSKAPTVFLATLTRSLVAAGVPWIALYTPQQVADASQETPNFSPAMIVYPKEKLRYIESFPPELGTRLLTALSTYAHTQTQRTTAQQLLQTVTSTSLSHVEQELFRKYCHLFAASEHISTQLTFREDPVLVADIRTMIQTKAAHAIIEAATHPARVDKIITAMETEYVVFGSLFQHFLAQQAQATEALRSGTIPHLYFDRSTGVLPAQEIAQIQQWYYDHYTDQEFAHHLANEFIKTDWEQSNSVHYRLYYSPTDPQPTPESGKLIGYMRISTSTKNSNIRYMGNLHIAHQFQGYRLLLPFFATSLEEEGAGTHFALHAEPESIAAMVYQKYFGFVVTRSNEQYMQRSDGSTLVLDYMERGTSPVA